MNRITLWIVLLSVSVPLLPGCTQGPAPYGNEAVLVLPGKHRQVWAVAPALNLSGQREVDPLLQSDLLYQQLQQVRGITAIPVNRTVEVYASLRIERVQTEQQAAIVCELLGADALLVPTVTAYDPYNPPKLGASLQLFRGRGVAIPAGVDPRELMRQAAPVGDDPLPQSADFRQVVGMYDAANGTVRDSVFAYAAGRNDPAGPMGSKEYLLSMDRYCGFVYHTLIDRLLSRLNR